MKKTIMLIVLAIMVMNTTLTVKAQGNGEKVGQGYTIEGIYYRLDCAYTITSKDKYYRVG